MDRLRRRSAGNWTAGALAVVLLGTGASLAGCSVTEPAAAPAPAGPSTSVAPSPELVEAPVRGSLADDQDFLAAMADAPWTDPDAPEPEPGTERVVYAADVPGGHRWAVVVARHEGRWFWTWFTGPRGAEPAEMTYAAGWIPLGPRERLALMDVSATTGPLVVLGEPGLEAEYSPSLDRAPSEELVRDFDPLPMVDGVPLGVVPIPVTLGSGEVQITSSEEQQQPLLTFPGESPSWPAYPTRPVDSGLFTPCLERLGLTEEFEYGLRSDEAGRPPMSSAEEAALEHQIAACLRTG
ncbi:hypothetical protein [Modestobacter sp. VKM Ac-2984]|uniref:hypothetical protein n=1 Tax=Modestobacter sp. VKM Ac-2984 TaxID=3004138 RepID=UPI0022AA08A1|nr:hypothetical protein [Modestobacter sp. VKM Ac-2984]MCZ2818669.1 hypothetical protein [Modestobacter sp. VKM Ac-2984]